MARKRKKRQREAEGSFGEVVPGAEVPGAEVPEHQRLTPVDIQQKVFRLAFRGYNERDVDEFLDGVTEDLAALHEENKRLREQIAEGGGAPGGLEEAQRQAEGIVRQAREHAARLVEDAEVRATEAGAGPAMAASGLPTSFLLQERQFLQQMAGLIQDHARRLKDDARRARAAEPEPEDAPASHEEPQAETPPAAETGPPSPMAGPAAAPIAEAPEPTPEPPLIEPQPEPPEEATAPWTSVDPSGEGTETSGDDHDPLVSAWESAFTAEGDAEGPGDDAAPYPSKVRNRKDDDEGEPSLRELFWGDEG